MDTTWPSDNSFNPKPVLIFVAIALALAGLVYITVNAHALDKHGSDVISEASQCFEHNSPTLTMSRSLDKRNASVCFDGTHFHVYITTQEGNPVTLFTKEKMKTIQQVVQYLCNAGYIPNVPAYVCP